MRGSGLLELRAIFKGRVQGVGLRAAVKRCADQLNLLGFVRNLPDGNVEVNAQGIKSALEQLLDMLRLEFGNRIKEIDIDFVPISQSYSHFSIVK